MHSADGNRDHVLARLNSDDASGAVLLVRKLLSNDPDNADLLGLLGIALESSGDMEGGAEALRLALSQPAAPSIRLRNATNLAALLFDSGKTEEARALLRDGWRWPVEVPPGDNERQCMSLLANIMSSLDLNAELVGFLLPVVGSSAHDWPMLKQVSLALAAIGQPDTGLQLVAGNPEAGQANERQAVLAHLYSASGRSAEATEARRRFIGSAAPYLAPARRTQLFTIAVINPAPSAEKLTKSDHSLHYSANYPAQLVKKLETRYRFASLFFGSSPNAIEALKSFKPRVVINNMANAEILRSQVNLLSASELAQELAVPVVNHPKLAVECTRQLNSTRLQGVPNVLVPRVSRFTRDVKRLDELIAQIEQSFSYPIIVRTTADQESKNMAKVDSRPELKEALVGLKGLQIYVIKYAGAPRFKDCYRRIRAAFVEGKPFIMRADYDRNWIVQGRKRKTRQAFYRDCPDMISDADDMVRRPRDRLGVAAMDALTAIGQLLPLDVFGMDFDVDELGRVIFFEANATMNLFSNAPTDFAYPPEADAALLDSLDQLLQRRADPAKAPTAPDLMH